MTCLEECLKPYAKPILEDDSVCDNLCVYKIVDE